MPDGIIQKANMGQATQQDVDILQKQEDAKKRDEQRAKWIQRAVRLGIPLSAAIAGSISNKFLPQAAGLASGINTGVEKADKLALEQQEFYQKQQEAIQKQNTAKNIENLLTGAGASTPGAFKAKGFTHDGITYEREQTPEEINQDIINKAKEQAVTTLEKERQLNISKVKRLSTIADTIEKKYLETEPGSGLKGRLSGLKSVPASLLQTTEQQQIDSAYRSFVKGMRAQLARAMGDVGNLSEPEQKAAMDLVPSLTDTKEVGMRKIQTIRDFVKSVEGGNTGLAREILGSYEQQQAEIDPLGIR